ncbi:MAG: YitT family protein [Lachnospiraceae bacterium]|nr:YitT family protein [Lachnospiraceae bacterium]
MFYKFASKINNAFLIIIGSVVAAFAISEFLTPNHIFDGGVVGISMIIAHFTPIKLGILTIILNIPFLIFAWKTIGHTFIMKAGAAMVIFSTSLSFFESMEPTTDDPLLATVFGGIVLGFGVGLVLRGGGCLDGTEIVGIIISRKTSLSVGNVVFGINIVIYIIAGVLFGMNHGLYSIIMYFISSKVIDMIESGMEQGKSVMIVTENGRLIADEIYKQCGRTVTFLSGEGLVSGTGKDILYCVVTRAEIHDIRRLLNEIGVESFTTVSDISEIIGTHIKQNKNKKTYNELLEENDDN